ncbi:MAG: helix-turn-helix transcriptional regulator [Sphaerochaeta sp.]|nr:helix-turn-helix transcriptional regulator [Sphaerochaeta sp.]MDD3512432.1 helix-turn-helix transcriptional regulator [Synergistaceae bacterium]MDD3916251.1 helix-turn-helix transcriptional regulator [Synergistaceae bacterium]
MRTWDDYKDHIKATDPEGKKDIEEIESLATIVGTIIEQRNALGMTQRELASMCGIPQSSVARIESFKTTPNLETLLKIMQPLRLRLTISTIAKQ